MPKIAKHSRSPLQERLLTCVALLQFSIGEGAYFSEKAINRIMGGRFTKYRATHLDDLVDKGWLEKHRRFEWGWNYYRLSKTGFQQLSIEYDVKPHEIYKEGLGVS